MPDRPPLLVVGGTGFLGRALVRAAPAGTIATWSSTEPTSERATWHRLDLADGGETGAAMIRDLRPRAVINAAYVSSGDDLMAITGHAPGTLAGACRAIGARFVHLSTDVVFDGTSDGPYRETDPVAPVHDYGRAKVESERLVAEADPGAAIVRTSLLFGDADDPGHQALLVADPSITFFTDETRNPLPVASLAAACLEIAGRPEIAGPLHVAGADTVSRYEFARHLAPLVGVDPATVRGGPGPPSDRRPKRCPLDSSTARSVLTTPLPGLAASAPPPEI